MCEEEDDEKIEKAYALGEKVINLLNDEETKDAEIVLNGLIRALAVLLIATKLEKNDQIIAARQMCDTLFSVTLQIIELKHGE